MSFGIIKVLNQFGISIECKILHSRYVDRKICNFFHQKVTTCNHQADSPLYVWGLIWWFASLGKVWSCMTLNVLTESLNKHKPTNQSYMLPLVCKPYESNLSWDVLTWDVLTWDVLTWDVSTLGRFDLGRFDLGRFDLGRFDYGTFWHWDVLTGNRIRWHIDGYFQ